MSSYTLYNWLSINLSSNLLNQKKIPAKALKRCDNNKILFID